MVYIINYNTIICGVNIGFKKKNIGLTDDNDDNDKLFIKMIKNNWCHIYIIIIKIIGIIKHIYIYIFLN